MYKTNDQIYKYTLINKIGGGNFGEVWLAKDKTLNTTCALKLLDNNTSIDERLLEAQIGNRLQHNNVVNIKYADVVQYGNPASPIVIIAMPFYKNGSVLSQLNSCNFMRTDLAIKCLIDVLRGLEYLHESGYYHCDIKPNNILVGDNGEYVLSDYGITCFSPNHTAVHPRSCYLPHTSPETISQDIYDARTDIYQLGLTAFRLLNGISEIKNDFLSDPYSFRTSVLNGKLIADSKYKPFVPKKLRRIISKATAFNPEDRYQTALEMRRALEQIALKGYCNSNTNGDVVFISNKKEYRFEITSLTERTFNINVYQKNQNSGRETRTSKYCCSNLKKSDIRKHIQKLAADLI